MTPMARFASKVAPTGENGCMLWTGSKNRGYGAFWLDGRRYQAHIWAWCNRFGPVPKGLQLDHLCRNRACVNPAHLEPVTARENLLRGNTHAARNAKKTACPKGHPLVPGNLDSRSDGARACLTCHRERARVHRAADPEKYREATRRWRARNKKQA